jgi:Fur family ferric uptake transcriptional regulator
MARSHKVHKHTEECHPDHSHEQALHRALEVMKTSSLKGTQARVALLEFLTEKHGPFSPEDLHNILKEKNMDLVTIYRTLASFEKIGLVRRCDFGDGVSRYEFESEKNHHHHVVCRNCKKVENLDKCSAKGIQKLVEDMGYTSVSHNMEFFGICSDCRREA